MNPGAYSEIDRCRLGGTGTLQTVMSLGRQALTGVFPRDPEQLVTRGPLDLVWCSDSGLLQLKQSYSLDEMYGLNYGYRSGLNQSMVDHLSKKVGRLERRAGLSSGDRVLDIGSNDATLLKAYSARGIHRVGVDPTGVRFSKYYENGINLVPTFFTKDSVAEYAGSEGFKLITSIAMFYDLEDPAAFVRDVAAVLHPEGLWHFEQSYMPSMLRMTSYDTICHEHLEYYSLGVVASLLERQGLRAVDVEMNGVNGGSFAVTACHKEASHAENRVMIEWLLHQEERMGLRTIRPFHEFAQRVIEHRSSLVELVRALRADGKKILGYGASTKGNVILQYCGFTSADISAITEVNEDKFRCYTPGTLIPIISEAEARAQNPDYFLVLPWHFKEGIVRREQEYLRNGGRLIFPLPEVEIV